jgi:hypothetical protein
MIAAWLTLIVLFLLAVAAWGSTLLLFVERRGYRGGKSAEDMPPPTKVTSARIRIEYFNDPKDNLDGPLD